MSAPRETVAETGSTNDDMRERAQAGAPEGAWLRADRQTRGRGRMQRPWIEASGNLYASTLVRLRPGDPAPHTLALVAAVALAEVAAAYVGADRVQLKWPNDLLLDRGGRFVKAAGILLERADDAVVAGFGVNLAAAPSLADREAAGLADLTGAVIAPDLFLDELADGFARWLAVWRGQGLDPVRERWLRGAHPIGTPLATRAGDGAVIDGLFEGLDRDGALLLRTAERVRTITAGDVFLI
ncbi:MAG: biotin--[acetyl-CoA-carboxylase] ligase [Sphingomonas sp.]